MKLTYVFVHGLSGWGSYDEKYAEKPYWGMKNGDVMEYLRNLGYDCCAASVAPHGSAWDRACELYAQLTGTRTDYGKVHSAKADHERFGKDFTGIPLISEWNEEHPIVLVGHSFGGATVRLFSHLLVNGNKEEAEAAEDASPFFKGNSAGLLRGIVTLAAPHNGTTAYDMYDDPDFDPASVKVPVSAKLFAKIMKKSTRIVPDGRASFDYASYDMHIDNADALNSRIQTLPSVYYWSYPACCTEKKNGVSYPKPSVTDPFFTQASARMGTYQGKTRGGMVIDASWQDNDGLVNTVSAKAPSHAPAKPYDPQDVTPGIWNIMPVYPYDHMSFQGGLVKKHDIFPFYRQMMGMIDTVLDDKSDIDTVE